MFSISQRAIRILFRHTERGTIVIITETVNHDLFDNNSKRLIRIELFIEKFSLNKIINLYRVRIRVAGVEKNDNICVWQTAFLIFDNINKCFIYSKRLAVLDKINKMIKL